MADSVTLNSSSAMEGLEAKLWATAAALRNNMDAAEYKHVVLGLIFLKFISELVPGLIWPSDVILSPKEGRELGTKPDSLVLVGVTPL